MTGFELAYRCAEPFLPPLYAMVRRELLSFARMSASSEPAILDVGGRKSHYTIGIPGQITVTELPRETSIQTELNLGLTDRMIAATLLRRTNIRAILYDDMTQSKLDDQSFDCVVAVEVLEHVEHDSAFIRNVHRVLRPGGMFLMTTPNGDSKPVPHNPDHKRHYTRQALAGLLGEVFHEAAVEYAIVGGRARSYGLRSWSAQHPLRTLASMAGNVINSAQSARADVCERALGTRHLIAVARRAI
jgi:SAM-dependent methyltransferase